MINYSTGLPQGSPLVWQGFFNIGKHSRKYGKAFRHVTKRLPDITKWFPDITERFPDITERFPNITGRLPDITGRFPDIGKRFPDIRKPLADLGKPQNNIRKPFPDIGKCLQDITKRLTDLGKPLRYQDATSRHAHLTQQTEIPSRISIAAMPAADWMRGDSAAWNPPCAWLRFRRASGREALGREAALCECGR